MYIQIFVGLFVITIIVVVAASSRIISINPIKAFSICMFMMLVFMLLSIENVKENLYCNLDTKRCVLENINLLGTQKKEKEFLLTDIVSMNVETHYSREGGKSYIYKVNFKNDSIETSKNIYNSLVGIQRGGFGYYTAKNNDTLQYLLIALVFSVVFGFFFVAGSKVKK